MKKKSRNDLSSNTETSGQPGPQGHLFEGDRNQMGVTPLLYPRPPLVFSSHPNAFDIIPNIYSHLPPRTQRLDLYIQPSVSPCSCSFTALTRSPRAHKISSSSLPSSVMTTLFFLLPGPRTLWSPSPSLTPHSRSIGKSYWLCL